MPYTPIQIIDKWLEPDFKFFINREGSIKDMMRFLMKGNNMKDEYLGACLDYIRWGGQTTVMYELGATGLINFIQHWMRLNKDNLIWSDKDPSEKFKLPYINHGECPRDEKHKGLIKDLGGRIRCSHKSKKELKPSFVDSYTTFDELSDMKITEFYELESMGPSQDEDGNNEKPTFVVNDVCYAILSDENSILSLEKVLDRLNFEPKYKTVYCSDHYDLGPCKRLDKLDDWEKDLAFCPGHSEENNVTVHPFCGWTLAWYVQKWYKQTPNGQAPVFEKRRRT